MPNTDLVPNNLQALNDQGLQRALQFGQQAAQTGGPAIDLSDVGTNKALQQLSQQAQGQNNVPGGVAQGPSPEAVRMLQLAHNYHATRRALAQQEFAQMNQSFVNTGIPPNMGKMLKVMKRAGIGGDWSPEGVKAAIYSMQQYYNKNNPEMQTNGGVGEMPPKIRALYEKVNSGTATKQDLHRFVMDASLLSALRSDRFANYTQQQKAALEQKGNKLIQEQDDALAGGDYIKAANIHGRLAAMFPGSNFANMTADMRNFAFATPQQKQQQIAMASGEMSPKERAELEERVNTSAQNTFPNADLAQKYAHAIAYDEPIPADVLQAMKKPTPQNLTASAAALSMFANAGVTGDNLPAAMNAFLSGEDYSKYLPPKTPQQIQTDMAEQQLQLQKIRTGAEVNQANAAAAYYRSEIGMRQAEAAHLDAETKALAARGISGDPEMLKLLAESIDAFAKIPKAQQTPGTKALQQQMEDSLAPYFGGELVRKPGWFGHVTTEFQADPNLNPQSVIGPSAPGTPTPGTPASQSLPVQTPPILMPGLNTLLSQFPEGF